MRKLISLAFLLTAAATAQTNLPFSYRAQTALDVSDVLPGGTLNFQATALNTAYNTAFTATYNGSPLNSIVITGVTLTGATDFTVTNTPDASLVLTTGRTFQLGLSYLPSVSRQQTARLTIAWAETAPTRTSTVTTTGTATFTLVGTAPEFALSYVVAPAGSTLPLGNGTTVALPATLINSDTSTATISIQNRGTAPGTINNITSSANAAFALAGLPIPPATVNANQVISFTVRYTPTVLDPVTGTVRIDFPDRSITFNISGSGTGPLFAYDVIQRSGVSSVLAGGAIAVPDATVGGDPSTVVVRVRNSGNADGNVAGISITGIGYSLTEVPFTPLKLTPGASLTFTINFNPASPGRAIARLRVGADLFDVSSNGIGPTLAYSYQSGDVSVSLPNASSAISFTPIAVGGTSTVRVIVSNTGTAAGALNSIVATGPQGPSITTPVFDASDLPALPMSLAAGASVSFTVRFNPSVVGAATGTLRIDNQTFPLAGSGTTPPPLPEYTFSGASGAQEAQTQLAIGLAIARRYPINLSGTLTLAFNSDVFGNDPAVQFAPGGRTIVFQIPAGSTQAVFPNGQQQVRLQTGTVAGTLTVTPSFTTDGGLNLTPATPPALNLTVGLAAPRLQAVQLLSKTSNSFTILVTGYATGRSITSMDVTFTAVGGENVATQKLTLDVSASFQAWYNSQTSLPFGSQFTATLPFNLQGDVKSVSTVVDTIQSVAVTMTNRQGTSGSRSVDLK